MDLPKVVSSNEIVPLRGPVVERLTAWHGVGLAPKEPYGMSMVLGVRRATVTFFGTPAHLCTVTSVTKISFNVTLSNQFHN